MNKTMLATGAVALLLAACGDKASEAANASDNVATPDALTTTGPCPDDGGRLPITGICAGRAVAYLTIADGTSPDAPEGCEWTVQETRIAEDVLLYRAASCAGKTTRLAYAAGSGLSELAYDTAAYGDPENSMKGDVVARITGLDRSDKTAALLRVARDAIDDAAERARCRVRNAGIDGWPADALVVDTMTLAQDRAMADDGPRAACGPFGFNGDEASYWRVFGGRSWFFQLGQDLLQIDPASFTLMTKDPAGGWKQAD